MQVEIWCKDKHTSKCWKVETTKFVADAAGKCEALNHYQENYPPDLYYYLVPIVEETKIEEWKPEDIDFENEPPAIVPAFMQVEARYEVKIWYENVVNFWFAEGAKFGYAMAQIAT